MRSSQRTRRSEQGAIIIHVALALLVLLAFSAFVVDYGLMWVSRRQAQNAADAAAMAAAVALAFDSPPGVVESGPAKKAAVAYAAQNPIWGQAPTAADVDVLTPADGFTCPSNVTGTDCVRADVYRGTAGRTGGSRGVPLPIFFASLVGLTNQGVRATATAQTAPGDFATCVKPWAIPDKWNDVHDPPQLGGWFDGTDLYEPALGDIYIPPYYPTTTGFTLLADYGRQLVLKSASPGSGLLNAGWVGRLNLPGSQGSGDYEDDIKFCNPQSIGIADPAETCPAGSVNYPMGCGDVFTGVGNGPTKKGVNYRVGLDPSATWDAVNKVVVSTMDPSPRVVPAVIFDPDHYVNQGCSGGTQCSIKIVNMIGFFLEGMCNTVPTLDPGVTCEDPSKDVVGRIVKYASVKIGTNLDKSASFLSVIRLVR